MNPSAARFLDHALRCPASSRSLTARAIDIDAAIKNALANRTDLQEFKKSMENTDINLKFAANQKLPAVDLNARYGLAGVAGTQFDLDRSTFPPTAISASQRSFGEALRDVFANDFKTWSFSVNVSYPIGTSQADAAYAQAKLQKQQEQTQLAGLELQITQAVREAAPAGEHQPEARRSDAQSARAGRSSASTPTTSASRSASRRPSSCCSPSAISPAPSRASCRRRSTTTCRWSTSKRSRSRRFASASRRARSGSSKVERQKAPAFSNA